MFEDVANGNPPSLVDLPTGAGKTDLIVIWLIALAWYGHKRSDAKPIPRRLVWVVNRRVLVQQVHEMVNELRTTLNESESETTKELKRALQSLYGFGDTSVLNIVQLRGQRLDDREWSLTPTQPQLIIGTVDQIGSRLLFQGYGQGKWSRPLQAALLGIDAWVCVDEAHLVPAFAVTLRQIRQYVLKRPVEVASTVPRLFDKLPSWFTELSATPGLPEPRYGKAFRLDPELGEESDEAIAPRIVARKTRRVTWKPLTDKKNLADALATEAIRIAREKAGNAVAVFCCKATDADKVAKEIEKSQSFPGRVVLVTGRLRGFERDRLERDPRFRRFKSRHSEKMIEGEPPTFLVGTSAAEVGLDADASAIVCDFANLITITQRIGRLDRRGELSVQAQGGSNPPPTMTIIGGEKGNATKRQLDSLAERLKQSSNYDEFDATLFTGNSWSVVLGKDKGDTDDDQSEKAEFSADPKHGPEDAVLAASWQVLGLTPAGVQSEAIQPENWLGHPFAPITAGPVVVPPLSDATLRHWAATTPSPTPHLPVHPWLYGLLPDEEGTPLVSIAFRLELDVLAHCKDRDDESEESNLLWETVKSVLTAFPPLRSEFHLVPIQKVREWLDQQVKAPVTLAHYDGENWTNEIDPTQLSSQTVILLPTSCTVEQAKVMQEMEIIPKGAKGNTTQPLWDVFEEMAADGARYMRQVEVTKSSVRADGLDSVYRVNLDPDAELVVVENSIGQPSDQWKRARLKLTFEKSGIAFTLRYWSRKRSNQTAYQSLNDHQNTASDFAERLAQTLVPDDAVLSEILKAAAADHDLGKDHDKWQHAMGNTRSWRLAEELDDSVRIAKPVTETPARVGGYRHEWGTVMKVKEKPLSFLEQLPEADRRFYRDLYLHLIAAHHGYFRPSMPDRGFDSPPTPAKQNPLRLECIERAARLQKQLGYWRLAYLESLLKVADVAASRDAQSDPVDATENNDET